MTRIDSARPPREGENLDLATLEPYLREHLPQVTESVVVEQFPGGFSNLTYLLRSGDFEMVLRRPPFGNRVKTAHDMGREFRVLSALQGIYPLAPEPYVYCEEESVLGDPFYVMERRRGIILRKDIPEGIDFDEATARGLSEAFVDNLATFHRLDVEAAGLSDFGKPEGYVERQVEGWIRRYERARTHDWQELESVAVWLRANRPPERAVGLVHNDCKYDNLVLDPEDLTRILAMLDWEMCTLGDPLMDLGTSLAYWVEAGDPPAFHQIGMGPTSAPGSLTRREIVDRYAERTGFDVGNPVFYYAYGLYKLAGVVQQIYYRFAKGHTQDPRFAQLHQMARLLGVVAANAIEHDRI